MSKVNSTDQLLSKICLQLLDTTVERKVAKCIQTLAHLVHFERFEVVVRRTTSVLCKATVNVGKDKMDARNETGARSRW